MPAAMAVPAPVLDPPGVRSGSHGLRAGGNWSDSDAAASPNSCVANFPVITAPAARARRNEGRRLLCDMSRQQARARRGRPELVEVLEGNRHPVESAEPAPIPDLFLVVGTQRRVQGLDPAERGARDLDRRQPSRSQKVADLA